MEKSKLKLLATKNKGFSLIEVVVALVILSTSVVAIYNLILSTSGSIYKLEDHYLSKEVANNRIALIHTLEKPNQPGLRSGSMDMGGKTWIWEESFNDGITKDFLEYQILIKAKDSKDYVYKINGYIANE
jgi:general secretion pathway protein I